ncbi:MULTISPECIES: EscF/YscF/HrpA family type III secretion system needle major subunit [Pseudomonas]|jgi:type III secretion protein F|uniref:EscF/YscF/HrpA family type III secretion system needle major subunit n=1 Tax=Pseudomonas soli TaxID=1306993 RepID=A0A2V4IJD5_9PSED|nr:MULTISPECIES: EscF/YscF/HrpA family type III secretion system needle major subunit [Pseudomonas]PYB81317.1 hypothetical protein DMX07_14430 [Pseudomonas soli]PZW76046.1 type III secretion protein F [Pseudomonas sp. 2848]QWA31733.1 hypothetical protein KHO27_12890 [Pseudomonas sp. RC3H12]
MKTEALLTNLPTGFHDGGPQATLEKIHNGMISQGRKAHKAVLESIDKLHVNGDDPAALADLRHRTTMWSNALQVDATMGQTLKNTISSILQKF